jgi:hypothetical protein
MLLTWCLMVSLTSVGTGDTLLAFRKSWGNGSEMKVATAILLRPVFTSTSLWTQATSQIYRAIRDSNDLAVPSAKVKAKQTATSAVRTTLSGANGTYVRPDLPISPYLLEITKRGFRKFAQTGIDAERSPRCL